MSNRQQAIIVIIDDKIPLHVVHGCILRYGEYWRVSYHEISKYLGAWFHSHHHHVDHDRGTRGGNNVTGQKLLDNLYQVRPSQGWDDVQKNLPEDGVLFVTS